MNRKKFLLVGRFAYESYISVYVLTNHNIPRDPTRTADLQYRHRSCRFRVLYGVAGLSGSLRVGSKLSNSSNPTQFYLPSEGTSSGVQLAPLGAVYKQVGNSVEL